MNDEEEPSVRLTIPARSRYLRLARLTAAGIASDLGFTLQGIEDVRIAVDEACAILIEACGTDEHNHHELDLHYGIVGDKLLIEGRSNCGAGQPVEMHAVARELLEMTADEHEVHTVEGGRAFRLVKHRQDASV
jgi:anti-sigma regulatory factor (Ser/Thr protein kinase)